MMPNGCSTFARTWDFVRFYERSSWVSLRVFLLYLSKPVSEGVVWRMDRVVGEMRVAIIECWLN